MYTVRFQDGHRDVCISADGRPVAFPRSIRVRSERDGCIEVEPVSEGIGTDGPDILVGELPIPFMSNGRIAISWLALPPPPPLKLGDVSVMWSRIASLGYPLPAGNPAQGLHAAAAAGHGQWPSPGLEVLPHAHATAVRILGSWPSVECTTSIWRPIDVPGGREDERATEKVAGRWPATRRADGTFVPSRTGRVMPTRVPWRSSSLSRVAATVVQALEDLALETGWDISSRRTFDLLARRARPPVDATDPPVSTWPQPAADALRAMHVLLADLQAAQSGPRRAPLSYLWKLYEAWVAAELGNALAALPGVVTDVPPQPGAGCDWHARYTLGTAEFVIVSQARLAGVPHSCPPLEAVGLRSVTSVLLPDILVASRTPPDSAWTVIVFDAKHRAAGHSMDPGRVAEAGSKYLWGVRRDPDVRGVDRVVIVSTEGAGEMFGESSSIESVKMLPIVDE